MPFAVVVIASTTKLNEIIQNLFIFNDQLKIKPHKNWTAVIELRTITEQNHSKGTSIYSKISVMLKDQPVSILLWFDFAFFPFS